MGCNCDYAFFFKKSFFLINFNYKRTMSTIPRHDGNRNGMASAAQRHISHPPTDNSACAAAILNSGDHFAEPCTYISAHLVRLVLYSSPCFGISFKVS
jgi:hypothetical protein